MKQSFSENEWRTIFEHLDAHENELGLPERRAGSLLLGSFNIRKLGEKEGRSEGAWRLLVRICERFDLLAIQEVQDELAGLRYLKDSLNTLTEGRYGLVASDITGSYPGEKPPPERLAFLFRWDRIERTEIASDITYDRGKVIDTLYGSRLDFWRAFDEHTQKQAEWQVEAELRKAQGKKPRGRPAVRLPRFLTFIRQPLCVSFRVPAAQPYEFLAVNAHLLYGQQKRERQLEFQALISWLVDRAQQIDRRGHPPLLLMGDLNLDFVEDEDRLEVTRFLKSLNRAYLRASGPQINFPFLDVHPGQTDVFRTNARLDQTFDQIAMIATPATFPDCAINDQAGLQGPDGYDYGCFRFVELFQRALGLAPIEGMSAEAKKAFYAKFEHDVSDHMPLWVRVPRPAGS